MQFRKKKKLDFGYVLVLSLESTDMFVLDFFFFFLLENVFLDYVLRLTFFPLEL